MCVNKHEAPLMLASVEAARARMLEFIDALPCEEELLDRAYGRVLAEPIVALRDQPPFAASAMDGYALRADDTPGTLVLIGESAAGAGYSGGLGKGQAVRIFTGAPLPEGADAIAIQEDVRRADGQIHAPETPAGRHMRARGIDFTAGRTLLDAGALLDGVALSLAAASGHAKLPVRRRPRMALLSTGDEIVAPGAEIGPHQIYESVSFGLAGLIQGWGGEAIRLAPSGDDVGEIAKAAREAMTRSDLLITIGGASVGEHDLVKPALASLGLALAVDKVAVRPGKPTWFGQTSHGPALGLPGNPASALVCAFLFLRPILDRMLGRTRDDRSLKAHLAGPLAANGPREHYLRARLSAAEDGRLLVAPFEQQDSSLLSVFQNSNALVRLQPHAPALQTGERVEILPLDRS
jgi:molybdopterin molybdotransferase